MNKSFLLINPFGIGDVIFSSPVISAIKEVDADAKISYLCNSRVAEFLKCHPLIDNVIVYDRDEFVKERQSSILGWVKKMRKFLAQIKSTNADCTLDFSMNTYFGLFALLGGIKVRVGLNYKNRGKLLTKKINISGFEGKHVTEFYADVARMIEIPVKVRGLDFQYDQESEQFAKEFFQNNYLLSKNIIGIAPLGGQAFGSQASAKQWPKDKFAELLKKLVGAEGQRIILFGSRAEKEGLEGIIELSKLDKSQVILACNQSIVQTAALIDLCDYFIANDTGLLRIADALKKKCIALFGPVDDKTYGFYPFDKNRHRLLCTKPECWPCYKNFRLPECQYSKICLNDIAVDDVLLAFNELK